MEEEESKKRLCLIDADIILYRTAFAFDKPDSDLEEAKGIVRNYFRQIFLDTRAEHYKAILTGPNNFRKSVSNKYKANRGGTLPQFLSILRTFMINEFNCQIVGGLEADDVLSILATFPTEGPIDWDYDITICSVDKDLYQIPGMHYNPVTNKFLTVSEDEAEKFLWVQTLTGDSTDNIEGIKGVGPKTAIKAFDGVSPSTYKHVAMTKYIDRYGEREGMQRFIRTYDLVRIMRHADIIADNPFDPDVIASELHQVMQLDDVNWGGLIEEMIEI